ncbi:MAG: hypothetical protein HOK98_00400 [Rhodospirillaceae bacterium]|jgi:hypothetical protein|nr:hypothetical protein [Rhodospirillaceae bacterium]MBT5943177.1 hypothetical protein [Rhodospirillaceae bacterium]MBT6405591.1 hypothetical protein [Rhodospirillaceae bacterium]MBT6534615.1 hypothetical protein [Rhodospirillaceae bacterium]MBT7360965.1 hypothetical protein [Rhodospirillaceae bacterium]
MLETPLSLQFVPIILFMCVIAATFALVTMAFYLRQMRELADRLTTHLIDVANVDNQLSVVAQGVLGLTLELEKMRETIADFEPKPDRPA